MTSDDVTAFYDRHPYPPPVDDLDRYADAWRDGTRRRVDHHLMWPNLPLRDDHRILIAGCGTSQAAKYALRYPQAHVVGIDVSSTSIEHTQLLIERYELSNLELRQLPIEQVVELGGVFDHIVCTGVLHHLADPDAALRALSQVLGPEGALSAMVYAPYGRTGVYMIQEYCRRLGVGTSPTDIADLEASLREIPLGHPLSHLLRDTPDFSDPDALADALLHPRDRSYSVPEVFDFLERAGLGFGRWTRQAPYLPTCGSISAVPHGERIGSFPPPEQYAALELYRGTMTRHSFIAHHPARASDDPAAGFDDDGWHGYVAVKPHTVIAVEERLPPGAAAALLNRAHVFRDLVMFVDEAEKTAFDAIDGHRTMGDISAEPGFFQRLYDHDLIVIDASATSNASGGRPE